MFRRVNLRFEVMFVRCNVSVDADASRDSVAHQERGVDVTRYIRHRVRAIEQRVDRCFVPIVV